MKSSPYVIGYMEGYGLAKYARPISSEQMAKAVGDRLLRAMPPVGGDGEKPEPQASPEDAEGALAGQAEAETETPPEPQAPPDLSAAQDTNAQRR